MHPMSATITRRGDRSRKPVEVHALSTDILFLSLRVRQNNEIRHVVEIQAHQSMVTGNYVVHVHVEGKDTLRFEFPVTGGIL